MKKKTLRRQVIETAIEQRAYERGYRAGRKRTEARIWFWRQRYARLRDAVGMAPLSDEDK